MAVTESGGTWAQATEVTTPSNGYSGSGLGGYYVPAAFLGGVSCPSAGNCTAVGQYNDNAMLDQAMAVTESRGNWAQAGEVISPVKGGTDPKAELDAVSCPSAGNCTAVGTYLDGSGVMVVSSSRSPRH
jgi:hypothetical protein